MSGFAGVFTSRATDPVIAKAMIEAGVKRGEVAHSATRHEGGSFLAVQRFEWELSADFSGPVLLLEEGEFTVAADATLYYRDDLRRKLSARGIQPTGDTSSHLVLAAYRAWGAECTAHLEGDFAFVIWNRLSGEVFCARDFVGRRPLYYVVRGDTLMVASTMAALLAHPECPREHNLSAIGALASGLIWAAGIDTCYTAVQVLLPGHALTWGANRSPAVVPFWVPFVRTEDPSMSFEEAAEELRALIARATLERLAGEGPTSIWMSGGWDSTTLFGIGRSAMDAAGIRDRALLPVSISYPVGDPGREDELINDVANFWNSPIHWLDIGQIPLYRDLPARVQETEEPPAHMYEPWNRALAQGTRALGSRIALDGNGGDQLFQCSEIYLSDLLKQGRLVELAREWKIKRPRGLRRLLRMTVEPLLPGPLARLIAPISRSQNRHYLERAVPSWFRQEFVQRHRLVERDRSVLPLGPVWSRADAELRMFLSAPYWSYATSYMTGALLAEGVETRCPLIDRRVVEFALRRPTGDRACRRETKLLLRRAARGTLPDHILAPRPHRTGVTIGYSRREMAANFPRLFDQLLAQPLRLAELGIVDPVELGAAVARFKRHDYSDEMKLFYTLNTEMWLRAASVEPAMSPPVAQIA